MYKRAVAAAAAAAAAATAAPAACVCGLEGAKKIQKEHVHSDTDSTIHTDVFTRDVSACTLIGKLW